MDIHKQILDHCISEWTKYFKGISSYKVAMELNISHKKVRAAFNKFKEMAIGTLNEGVVLHPIKGNPDLKQTDEIVATIFYPSKESLEMNYKNSEGEEQEAPEFKKRLRLGHQSLELSYFSPSVIQKYLDASEEYNVQDTLCGGFISSKNEQIKAEHINLIRYGKRKIGNDKQVITAVLEDLGDLPEADQRHWHLSEIEDPDITLFDPEYHKYHLKFFNSTPLSDYNPLQEICETLKKINSLPHVGRLFKNIDNAALKYPVHKEHNDFCNSCDELYKVIGPENMNRDALQKYLSENYNYQKEDFINLRSGQPLSNEQLFRKLLKELGFLTCSIGKLINVINNHQIPEDHHVVASRFKSPDYLTEYKKLCQSLLISFTILYQTLNKDSHPFVNGFR